MKSVKNIFFLGMAKKVYDGRGTRFWMDKWCSNVPLGILFLELFSVAQDPTGPVESHWSGAGWDIKVLLLTQDQFAAHTDELLQLHHEFELQKRE